MEGMEGPPLVVTDCKVDDMFAIAYLLRIYSTVRFIVSDVQNVEGACALLQSLSNEFQRKTVSFHEGDRRSVGHQHEEMFSLPGLPPVPTIEALPEGATDGSRVYWLAPYSGMLRFKNAPVVYGSMGHNIGSSGLTLQDMNQFNDFVTMNNFESFPTAREGGRFTIEQAFRLATHSNVLRGILSFAENNSIHFMAKQLVKFAKAESGKGIPHPSPLSYEELVGRIRTDHKSLIPYVTEVFECVTGVQPQIDSEGLVMNPTSTYLDRVFDQIMNGVQIELTDLQHVVAYNMPDVHRVRGNLVLAKEKDGFREFRFHPTDSGTIMCIKGLTRERIWNACVPFFL